MNLHSLIRIKEDTYKSIHGTLEGLKRTLHSGLNIIDINQEKYRQRLDPTILRKITMPLPSFVDSRLIDETGIVHSKQFGSSQGSDSRLLNNWSQDKNTLSVQRPERQSDVSMVAIPPESEGGEEEMDEDEEEDFELSEFRISNTNFINHGTLFSGAFPGNSRGRIGPPKQVLVVSEPRRKIFLNSKVTSLAKYPGDDTGNMALWVGGPKQLMGFLRNNEVMKYLELDQAESPISKNFTSHICYLNSHILFFTSCYNLLVMNLSGEIAFVTDISVFFNQPDYVVCSLSDSDSSCLILGTNEGRCLVIEVQFSSKTVIKGYEEQYSPRKLTSFIWLDDEEKTFFYSTIDRTCGVVRFENKDSLQVLRIFNYNLAVNTSIKLGSLLVLAFSNGHIGIVEPLKGEVLVTLQPNRIKEMPIKQNDFNSININWMGYLYLGSNEEFNEHKSKLFKEEPANFEEFLYKVRFICKFDDGNIVIFGYPTEATETVDLNIAGSLATHSNFCDSRKLPIILERFNDRSMTLRVFSIEREGNHDQNVLKDKSGDNAVYCTWMVETEIQIKNAPDI